MHPITWNVDRVLVYLPYVQFPIYWYGLFFALGIYSSQKWLYYRFSALNLLDNRSFQNLIFSLVIGIVIGARLGDLLFYQDLRELVADPLMIINLRAGGLASHGGVMGFLIALIINLKKYKIPFYIALAEMSAPAGLLAACIRIGNFFNQEILGKAYSGPFSIIFKEPFDHSLPIPRHPVVLYEALMYGAIAVILARLNLEPRKKTGLALLLFFGSRIILELFKEESSLHHLPGHLSMGMLLSFPLLIWGLYLMLKPQKPQLA